MNIPLKKSERTRQFIIEKSAHVFNKQGYVATSLTDLTEATGLSKGSIYGNFKNKEEVAAAAFDYNFSLIVGAIRDRISKQTNSIDKLLEHIRAYRESSNAIYEHGGCAILNTAIDADFVNPMLKKRVTEVVRQWLDAIHNIVVQGIERGEIRGDVDPARFAAFFVGLTEGGVFLFKATSESHFIFKALDHLEDAVRNLRPE
jgi:AcrR family transcriptional regulator